MSDFHVQETPSILVPPSDMHRHFGDLLSSKAGVNVEFRVGGETFSAHRLVLAARSPVFRAQFFGPMKEGTTTEAISVDDVEAVVFSALLTFMYTDALPGEMKHGEESAMAQHLLVAADKYGLDRLKLICEDKLSTGIDTSSAATILALAEQHHCRGLKAACLEFLSLPTNLAGAMESECFEFLAKSCPGVLKDLLISQLELFLSSGTVCLSLYSLSAGMFGLNIPYTWNNDHGHVFKWVVLVSGLFCAFMFVFIVAYAWSRWVIVAGITVLLAFVSCKP